MNKIFVITGPSGVGKDSIVNEILRRNNNLKFAISHVTREKREGEINGKNYRFINTEEFEHMIKNDEFLEWINVFGNYYGTSKQAIDEVFKNGYNVICIKTSEGMRKIKNSEYNSVSVFIKPPCNDVEVLREHLRMRGTETAEQIEERLFRAGEELKEQSEFDYVIVSDELSDAINDMQTIIDVELRQERSEE